MADNPEYREISGAKLLRDHQNKDFDVIYHEMTLKQRYSHLLEVFQFHNQAMENVSFTLPLHCICEQVKILFNIHFTWSNLKTTTLNPNGSPFPDWVTSYN